MQPPPEALRTQSPQEALRTQSPRQALWMRSHLLQDFHARLNFRQMEESHLMENILYNELRFRGYKVDVGEMGVYEQTDRSDHHGKTVYTEKKLEVDFIATSGSQKFYIQSALSLAEPEKEKQEKRSLAAIDDSFSKIVIARNGLRPWTDERGIVVVDLFDFLLSDQQYVPIMR